MYLSVKLSKELYSSKLCIQFAYVAVVFFCTEKLICDLSGFSMLISVCL